MKTTNSNVKTLVRECPFCRSAPSFSARTKGNSYCLDGPLFKWDVTVKCTDCGVMLDNFESVTEAIDFWNKCPTPFIEGEHEGLDVPAMEAKLGALPEAGPEEEEALD